MTNWIILIILLVGCIVVCYQFEYVLKEYTYKDSPKYSKKADSIYHGLNVAIIIMFIGIVISCLVMLKIE